MEEIRALQHFLYCPHRWELLYVEGMWQDNAFTVNSELAHSRVHNEKLLNSYHGKLSLGDITLYSNSYGVYGKADCLELTPDKGGVSINGYEGKYKITVVEYKPTQRKSGVSPADRLQLYAQKVCADEIFSCSAEAFVYYADVKKRVKVEFDISDEELLRSTVEKIAECREKGIIPPIEYGKKCSGCSLYERCMPRCKPSSTKENILRLLQCENY